MKLFTGWPLAVGLVLSATAAAAQVPAYVDGPYRARPYYAVVAPHPPLPPGYVYGSYGYGPGYAPIALVPPHEVYNIIRRAGFSPLDAPRQRGFVYRVAVIDRGGEDGRLIIDARSGRILRFVQTWQQGSPDDRAWSSPSGPPDQLSPSISGSARPGAPQVAGRSVSVPKPSPLAARQPEPAKPLMDAAKPPTEPSTQQAAAQTKPDTSPATTGSVGQVQARPAEPILATQEMPKAQGLE